MDDDYDTEDTTRPTLFYIQMLQNDLHQLQAAINTKRHIVTTITSRLFQLDGEVMMEHLKFQDFGFTEATALERLASGNFEHCAELRVILMALRRVKRARAYMTAVARKVDWELKDYLVEEEEVRNRLRRAEGILTAEGGYMADVSDRESDNDNDTLDGNNASDNLSDADGEYELEMDSGKKKREVEVVQDWEERNAAYGDRVRANLFAGMLAAEQFYG